MGCLWLGFLSGCLECRLKHLLLCEIIFATSHLNRCHKLSLNPGSCFFGIQEKILNKKRGKCTRGCDTNRCLLYTYVIYLQSRYM